MGSAKKPKILVLFCGGTIVMEADPKTGALDVAGGTQTILDIEPRLKDSYDIEVHFVDNIDSSNMTTSHWNALVGAISKNYPKYDGFVITHGTNTLAYTSSALSFALKGIGKPVVLTGAQIPANKLESDARRNFVNAVKLAGMDIAGVYVVFGSRIILGCRAKKNSEYDLDAFKTFNSVDVGEIGVQVKLKSGCARRHGKLPEFKAGFEANIAIITLEPGIEPAIFDALLKSGVKGFVIRGYGAGDLPYSLLPFLEQARKQHVPVIVTTQCPSGATKMGMNLVGAKALEKGVVQAFDMSMESMTTKLRWLLSHKTPYEKIKENMETDFCGEVVKQADKEEQT